MTLAHVTTVAFVGIEARPVEVEVQISSGVVSFLIVGLPDKAVTEARERVRGALSSLGLGLPPKRITVNLSPADLPKEGGHYDLPIALGILAAMGVLDASELSSYSALGELSLDGRLQPVSGVLPAAMAANAEDKGLICPAACGPEAAWAGEMKIIAAPTLLSLINHFKGTQILAPPQAAAETEDAYGVDLRDVRGQETAKRVLEVAAAGGHNLLMIGPPGSGKSMLAQRLPTILPDLTPREALDVSLIQSVAGALTGGSVSRRRPFRAPHHSASMAALVGGGRAARPGEVTLAHLGVLFLDELPEFDRKVLDSLRGPLEAGETVVARANAHIRYPARVQLVAAMNPCRCGYFADPARACSRVPKCAGDYQARISGPLYDRIDLAIDVPAVALTDLSLPPASEGSAEVRARVLKARAVQTARQGLNAAGTPITNAELAGDALDRFAQPDEAGRQLLLKAAETLKLSARAYVRVLRVARTIADLAASDVVERAHIAEALAYRRPETGA